MNTLSKGTGMKSLDEVISELETIFNRYELEGCFYCSFQRECNGDNRCYLADTLYHLKEYKKMLERPQSERLIEVLNEVRK